MIVGDPLSLVYFGNTLQEYLKALLLIIASIIVGKIAYFVINRYIKKLTEKTETKLDDLIVEAIETPLMVAIVLAGIYTALQTLVIPQNILAIINSLLAAAFIVDAIWFAIRVVDIGIQEIVIPITAKTETTLDDQLVPIVSKGLKLIIALIGALAILSKFGIDVTALIAGLGIGGLAVALASKDTVENMFGAFAILIDKPFTVKDRVIIDGMQGTVLEIGLRGTRLLTLDNTELYIPNSKIVTGKVENISRPTSEVAVSATLDLTYETQTQKLEEAMDAVREILSKQEGILSENKPSVLFTEFGPSSLKISVKYWVEDYQKKGRIIDEVNRKIKRRFEEEKIEFAYPTQKVFLAK